jgi:hypothetical protein
MHTIKETTMTLISGNTYPVKTQLKALGGVWNPGLKGWMVPDARADEARDLVAHLGARPGPREYGHTTCKTCGKNINYGVYCGKCEYSY